jgi:transketolase
MRTTFIQSLINSADEKTYLLVGDVGYSVIEPYVEKYPNQYLNTGVAEQNMTGMSAGLALEGFKVFTYSIANFNTIRCLEQIRNDICYHNLDVTVVSVGGGFVYGSAGYSHHAIQDVSMLGSLPNITLLLPADSFETAFCMKYAFENTCPKYLRLSKNGEKVFHKDKELVKNINNFDPEIASTIALVSIGTAAAISFDTQALLKEKGIDVNIFTCPIIDGEFSNTIRKELESFEYIFTIEEHLVDFGFGSIIKNSFEDTDKKIKSFGLNRNLCKIVGNQDFLRKVHGLDAVTISTKITEILKNM